MDILAGMIIGFVSVICILVAALLIFIFVDGKGIMNNIKLKLGKGYILAVMFGKDRSLEFIAVKGSGKETGTKMLKINGLPYNFIPQKIRLSSNKPALCFYEDSIDPLDVTDTDRDTKTSSKGEKIKAKELAYSNITPEFLNEVIALARAAGTMPTDKDKQIEMLKTIAIFAAAAGAWIGVYLIYGQGDLITNLQNGIAALLAGKGA